MRRCTFGGYGCGLSGGNQGGRTSGKEERQLMSALQSPLRSCRQACSASNLTGFCFIGKAVPFSDGELKEKYHVDLLGSSKPDYKARGRGMCTGRRQASGAWEEGEMMGHLPHRVRRVGCHAQQVPERGCACLCERERESWAFALYLIQGARLVLPMSALF